MPPSPSPSPQALEQRFTPQAADTLRAVLHQALRQNFAGAPRLLPLLQRFQGVYLLDATVISLPGGLAEVRPGCGGSTPTAGQAALKIQLRWELFKGTLWVRGIADIGRCGPRFVGGRVRDLLLLR